MGYTRSPKALFWWNNNLALAYWRKGKIKEAAKVAEKVAKAIGEDAQELNNFAWALLTEERYGSKFDRVATKISTRSNELTGYSNWYYLDTLARAAFLPCARRWRPARTRRGGRMR